MLFTQIICLSAQLTKTKMSGRIIDSDSVPIAGASVLLLNRVDSSFIAGAASGLDGFFELSCSSPGEYILSLSMIGYKRTEILKQITHEANIEIGDVVFEENAYLLSGVTVTGQRFPFKIESGKTVVSLSSALLSADGNILDVLRKLPGVIIQNDGTVILNGKSGTNVLIDDKVTWLSGENLINYLRAIPAKSVENVELISQQSSKYDAAGNSGIINIQKKRIVEEGVNISASSGMERGEYNRWSEAVSLAVRLNRLNIYADYSAYWGTDLTHVFASRTYLNANPPLLLEMDATRKMQYRSQYIKTGIDYDLSEKITVGTYLSSNWLNRKKNEISISDFYSNDKILSDSTVTAPGTVDYNYTNIRGGADISYKWPGKGKWDTSFDYQLFNQGDDQMLASSSGDRIKQSEKDTLSGKTNGDIKLYSGQTNLNCVLNNKVKITAGLKTVLVSINSDAIYKNRMEGSWIDDNSLSSRFNYRENINAAYIQLNSE